jgi:hypothetical protein
MYASAKSVGAAAHPLLRLRSITVTHCCCLLIVVTPSAATPDTVTPPDVADGAPLVVTGAFDGALRMFNSATGRLMYEIQVHAAAGHLASSC